MCVRLRVEHETRTIGDYVHTHAHLCESDDRVIRVNRSLADLAIHISASKCVCTCVYVCIHV